MGIKFNLNKLRAFGIIEVVISSAVLMVALLGLAKMQGRAVLSLQDSDNNAAAALLAEDLVGKMRANVLDSGKGRSSIYAYADTESAANMAYITTIGALGNCYTGTCDSYIMAANDILEWQTAINNSLPTGAEGKVCFDSAPVSGSDPVWECDDNFTITGSQIVYTVKIKWNDRNDNEKIYFTQGGFRYDPWASLISLPTGVNRVMPDAEDWSQLIYDAILGNQPTYPVIGSFSGNAGVSSNASISCSALSSGSGNLSESNRDWICQKPCQVENNTIVNNIGLCSCTGLSNNNVGNCSDFQNGQATNDLGID